MFLHLVPWWGGMGEDRRTDWQVRGWLCYWRISNSLVECIVGQSSCFIINILESDQPMQGWVVIHLCHHSLSTIPCLFFYPICSINFMCFMSFYLVTIFFHTFLPFLLQFEGLFLLVSHVCIHCLDLAMLSYSLAVLNNHLELLLNINY